MKVILKFYDGLKTKHRDKEVSQTKGIESQICAIRFRYQSDRGDKEVSQTKGIESTNFGYYVYAGDPEETKKSPRQRELKDSFIDVLIVIYNTLRQRSLPDKGN